VFATKHPVLARGVQVGSLVLVALLSVAAAVSAVTAYELRSVSGDVSEAESHLPQTLGSRLPSSGGMLDTNQITLVSYGSGLAKGTSVLFATAPGHKFSSILSISPGVRIGSGAHIVLMKPPSCVRHPKRCSHAKARYHTVAGSPLKGMTVTQTITALRNAGIPVTHVALIDANNVGPLVDAVGGITVVNTTPFMGTSAGGEPVRFARGTLHLDGVQAAEYIGAATTRESLDAAENAALIGIVHAVLAPTGVEQLEATGQALAKATATDLTTADVLGLVEMRVRGGTLVQCRLVGPGNLSDPRLQGVVDQALGRTATQGPTCSTRHLSAAAVVPPVLLVKAAQHYGWQLFVGIAVVLAALAIILAAILKARWPSADSPRWT
jgi:cell envelope-related transcriptional attenuator-like protein